MILILSALAAFFSILGNLLIAFKKRIAFLIWIIGNLLWIWESIVDSLNVPLIVMNATYLFLNLLSYREWRKNKESSIAIYNKYFATRGFKKTWFSNQENNVNCTNII